MRSRSVVDRPYPKRRPACTCRHCRARRARQQPRIVESTLVTVGRPQTTGWRKQSRWLLLSAGLLLLVLLLLTGMGTLWDSGPLAPLLYRSTASVTIVPTRMDRQATRVITAVTETPDVARYEVAARFVSATSPQFVASGQTSGTAHVPATTARGTLTLYNAATVRRFGAC